MSVASQQAPDNTVRLMDKEWENIQKKTFTKWANSHLVKKGSKIADAEADFVDGILLMKLINTLFRTAMPKHNARCAIRPQQLDNAQIAIQMTESAGVRLNFLKPNHLVDKDLKMILGMLWAIILDYQIKGISVEEMSAKEGLLLWCQRKTKGYRDVNVENFTTSWVNGLALAALIHRHRPDLIDFDSLKKEDKAHNLKLCFDVAERDLGIAPLLDVEDLVNVARPDERSVMTYISEFYHKFSSQDTKEVAARRVQKFVQFAQGMEEMERQYLQSTSELLDWIQQTSATLSDHNFPDDIEQSRELLERFKHYKLNEKPSRNQFKLDTEASYANILTKLRANNRVAWAAPAGHTVQDVDAHWDQLAQVESDRFRALRDHISKLKEGMRLHYATVANNFYQWVTDLKNSVLETPESDLQKQQHYLQGKLLEIENSDKLRELEALTKQMEAAGIDENPHTDYTLEELSLLFDQLKNIASKKVHFIDGQIVAQTKKGVDPALIQEFKETFKHFDKDNSNSLDRLEFKACAQSLGVPFRDDDAFEHEFQSLTGGDQQVFFDPFVDWMIKQTEDTDSAAQIKASFKLLANDQAHIGNDELHVQPLTQNEVAFVVDRFPKAGGRIDYDSFVTASFV
eukprot:TRINITY_DN2465_c0_g1_i4.p1 TRINITY_DN2465_c0_g1~~TRINITY_DN2465_c0_g1_i4.p1  ORF type:complete len:644 (+),score=236.93 TRINITY_DN2465_c0_g1_i4:46-1932(+)